MDNNVRKNDLESRKEHGRLAQQPEMKTALKKPIQAVSSTTWDQFDYKQVQGKLDQQIREQLAGQCLSQVPQTTARIAHEAVDSMLKCEPASKIAQKLDELFQRFQVIFEKLDVSTDLRTRQYISATGLVMSPEHCLTTIKDTYRVAAFTRGIEQAISERLSLMSTSSPIHLVYPACGPLAPLVLPLLSYFRQQSSVTSEQLKVTLIDIQPGAVKMLNAAVEELEVEDFIKEIRLLDALDYQPEDDIDILVLEAMQHGFTREAHLPIAKHFADIMSQDSVMIPESISIRALLAIPQLEFCEQWDRDLSADEQLERQIHVRAKRTDVGEVVNINLDFLKRMQWRELDNNTKVAACNRLNIPELAENATKQTLLVMAELTTFSDEHLTQYQSGITHPLPDLHACINFVPAEEQEGDVLLNSGDSVRFYYRVNGMPGFLVVPQEEAHDAND